jgi:Tol biopolymer transport system component
MTEEPEDSVLLALGAAVADGAPVRWDDVEVRAGDVERQELIQGMREVAALMAAHRQVEAPAPAVPADSPRHWGHLVLFERVGQGAFGAVHRGFDPRLEREVAVKLLRPPDGSGPSPLAEARHLARIHHSNVVVVHGADQHDGQVGIWMEYIEGQTLAAMVREAGPMSAREVIGIGIDLCRALSAIHAAGLLHRDIKPQNVMREVGGRIVLMDFSGAEALTPRLAAVNVSGTPLYMAPELFDGSQATVPSDVYSLGILLFFLLTGTTPVEGRTLAELKVAHARRARKRLRDLRPDMPEAIVQVIGCATEQDPAKRYQTAGELEHALAAATGVPRLPQAAKTESVAAAPAAGTLRWGLPTGALWAPAGLLLGLAAAGAFVSWRQPAGPAAVTARFSIGPPYLAGSWPRLSPDGRLVVFGTFVEGRNRFWIRPLDSKQGHALRATTAVETPFWSPDSATLAFFADGKLKTIPASGGEPQTLTSVEQPRGGDWHGDRLIFAVRKGIHSIAADGTQLTVVTTLDEPAGEFQHAWPRFLPDGRRFLYVIRSSNGERTGLYVGSLDGTPPRRLLPAYSRATYAAGHLLWVREGTLMAQPFDETTATLSGMPVAITGGVKHHGESDAAFDVAPSGVLVYYQEPGQALTRLALFDRRGRERQVLAEPGAHRRPRFSPDGARVVAERASLEGTNVDLWMYDVARQGAVKLTTSETPDTDAAWSADGKTVAYTLTRASTHRIFTKTVDDGGPERPLQAFAGEAIVDDWSAAGPYIAARVPRVGLWIIPLDARQKPWMFRGDTRATVWQSEFSPDGQWLAYMSDASGSPEVFVEPFPATGARWQISTRGGAEPHWRPDGRELFYLAGDGTLMAIDVSSPSWQTRKPTPLFRLSVVELAGQSDYDVSPDGEQFVVAMFLADPIVPPIEVVVNWTSLLKN